MDPHYYAERYLAIVETARVYNNVEMTRREVGEALRDSQLRGNLAFVAIATAVIHGRALTREEFLQEYERLAQTIGQLPMEFGGLEQYVREVVLPSGILGPGDYALLADLAEGMQERARPPARVRDALRANAWYPVTQLCVTAYDMMRDLAWMAEQDEDTRQIIFSLADDLLRNFPVGKYGYWTVDEAHAYVLRFVDKPQFIQSIAGCIAGMPHLQVVDPEYAIADEDKELAAQMVAVLVAHNMDFESALAAVGLDLAWRAGSEMPDYLERCDPDLRETPQYRDGHRAVVQAFSAYMDIYGTAFKVVESVEEFLFLVREKIDEVAPFALAPFIFLMDAISHATAEIAKLVAQVTGAVLRVMDEVDSPHPVVRAVVGSLLMGLADIVDVRHRQNPKSVWAMLTSRKGARISKDELFLLQYVVTRHSPSQGYEDWTGDMIRRMAATGRDVSMLQLTPPKRAVFYPRNTYGPADNNDIEMAVEVNFHERMQEARRVQQALAAGAPRGIDSAWLADAATLQSSIDRYIVPRPILSTEAKAAIYDAADAVFDHFRELYDYPKPMSVASSLAAMEWKYSAGVPFIPVIRTRQQLKEAGWLREIAQAAQQIIDSGDFPDAVFHAFPKADVVPRDKVLADRSAARSVTAGDRLTACAANTLLLEVNKRIAPHEALVVNQLPRREGGLQHVYETLNQRDAFVMTDGWRFDSQVPPEFATIGSVRLYERGVEGMWGARAATSFVQAYYAAIAHGLVVNLVDGYVVRKTGGGGTGSAFTSSDNRNWVKIIFVASWSLCFNRPPSEFFRHVTLAHASDDIAMSVDAWMEPRLQEWSDFIFTEFGLRFAFENARRDFAGFLHLEPVKVDGLDRRLYEEVGIDAPEFPIRHDPLRTLMKRSDYRSDRMRHSAIMAADFLATQSFGHLLLTAHSPDLYSDILTEAIEATSEFMGAFFKDVNFSIQLNRRGQKIGCEYRWNDDPSPNLIRQAARIFGDPGTPEARTYMQRRQAEARRWARCHRYPSYLEVFRSWVNPEDWSKFRPAQKKWTKLVGRMTVSYPILDLVQSSMLSIADITARIPIGLTRWSGPDIAPVTRPLVTRVFMVELFVYRKFIENHGTVPSFGEFAAKCREAPYGSVTDPNAFWLKRNELQFDYGGLHPHEIDMNLLQGRMWIFTLFYGLIDYAQSAFRMNRTLGFVLAIFFLLVRDLDKWYSIIHLLYWLDKGEASIAISNMSPRDPFIAQKVMAMMLTALFPYTLLRAMGFVPTMSRWAREVAESMYYGARLRTTVATRVGARMLETGDRWTECAAQIFDDRIAGRITKIVAGMGSGKSTSLPATLLRRHHFNCVIVVVPTTSLVVNYTNEFIDTNETVRVDSSATRAMVVAGRTRLVVVTAHRFYGMLSSGADLVTEFGPATLVLIDEAHMATTAQWAVYERMPPQHPFRVILMSGTPGGSLWHRAPGSTYELLLPLPQLRTTVRVRTDAVINPSRPQTAVAWLQEFLTLYGDQPEFRNRQEARFAVYHPTMAGVADLALCLTRSGFRTSTTSAAQPGIDTIGAVVGTWAIVTGVNFVPPIDAMVDLGLEVRVRAKWLDDADLGGGHNLYRNGPTVNEVVPSSPSTAAQVAARTGRVARGIAYQSHLAGTGVERDPYPDIALLLSAALDNTGSVIPGWFQRFNIECDLHLAPLDIRVVGCTEPLSQWVCVRTNIPGVMIHKPIIVATYLLAIALGSVNAAINAIRFPDVQDSNTRDQYERIGNSIVSADFQLAWRHPPPELHILMHHAGLRVGRPGTEPFTRFGVLPVLYEFDLDAAGHNVKRTNLPVARHVRVLASSGQYTSIQDP